MKLELIDSKDRERLRVWDDFLMKSPRGHFALLSSRLRSFGAFGFDFKVLTATRSGSDEVVGGIGLLRFGNPFFKVMSAPIGPIADIGSEDAAGPILDATIEYARREGVSLLQMRYPCSAGAELPALLPASSLPALPGSRSGAAFDIGKAPDEMMWIGFPDCADDEAWEKQLLKRFKPQTRNKIRIGEKQGMEVFEARTPAELKEAYALIEDETRIRRAAFRGWDSFGETLIEQVNRRHAIVMGIRYEGRVIAVRYGALAGRRFSYISGARLPVDNLKVGQFLTWAVMKKCRELGLTGYDFSAVGKPGVMAFKEGFRPDHIRLLEPRFFVFSGFRYQVFNSSYRLLVKNKQLVSRVLNAAYRRS